MRPASLLKWAGLAIVLLVAAVAALLLSLDVDSYRDEIAAEFRKATGRSLAIDGDIDLSISLNPALVVEQVSIANAGWGSRPVMAAIERAEAEVELLPLLTGDLRMSRLVLIEPDILLETNADGLSNWQAERLRAAGPLRPPGPQRRTGKARRAAGRYRSRSSTAWRSAGGA